MVDLLLETTGGVCLREDLRGVVSLTAETAGTVGGRAGLSGTIRWHLAQIGSLFIMYGMRLMAGLYIEDNPEVEVGAVQSLGILVSTEVLRFRMEPPFWSFYFFNPMAFIATPSWDAH